MSEGRLARTQAGVPLAQGRPLVHDPVPRVPPGRGRPAEAALDTSRREPPAAVGGRGPHLAARGRPPASKHPRRQAVPGEDAGAAGCVGVPRVPGVRPAALVRRGVLPGAGRPGNVCGVHGGGAEPERRV